MAAVATAGHGRATRAELLAAGLSSSQIDRRVRSGALIPEFRGVYRVGHQAPSITGTYYAAVRACGSEAALSGRAAAHLLGLVRSPPPIPEVLAPTERRVRGVLVHRVRNLDRRDTWNWQNIRVTTVARTLVDLAATMEIDELARACHEATIRHRTKPEQVEAVLARRPGSRGAARLRSVLRGEVKVTLSKLEKRFLDRLRAGGRPLPLTNRPAGGRYVDCRWPKHKLTVELDSYRYHGSRHAWEQDRRREREAYARGDDFRRYTYGDVFESPRLMLAELDELFSRHRPA